MSFWGELRRRKVVKVAVAYAIVGWLLLQVVDVVLPTFNAPEWVGQTITLVLILGFPIVFIIAWAFEITPEGIKKTRAISLQESITHVTGRKLDFVIIGLMAVGIAFLVVDNYVLVDSDAQAVVQETIAPTLEPAAEILSPVIAEEDRNLLPNSIAVLPLANLSPNPDDAYFAAGLHDEILNQLAKLSALNVIARTSVLQYEGARRPIAEIASELNVETVMEGSVRFAGDRVRVTTQLIEATSGAHLWSETYERPFDDIFAIESDIAMSIANALEAEFSPGEQQDVEQVPTNSPAAYALYLQARAILRTAAGRIEAAHTLLDRAIEIDPGFARAYGMKAVLHGASFVNTVQNAGVDPEDRKALERQVRELAEQAFALDPSDRAARTALRNINIPTWRWSAYEEAMEPGDEIDLAASSLWIYSWMGKYREAVRLGERIAELNPNDPSAHISLGVVQSYAGDRAASITTFHRAVETAPVSGFNHIWLAFNEIALGNTDGALAELQLTEQLLGDDRPIVFLPELAYSYARIGRRDDVQRLFSEIQSLGGESDFGAGTWAITYLAIGDEERALEQLEMVADKASNHEPDQGYLNVMNLKMNYLADPTLDRPEFVDVLNRIAGD